MEQEIKTQRSMDKIVEDFEDEELQIRKPRQRKMDREKSTKRKEKKKPKYRRRLKYKEPLIAVMITRKWLYEASSLTSFSFSLFLHPPTLHAEALTANTPTEH